MKISERIFPKINDQNILLIGYGEMNEIVSKYFINLNPRKLSVCSRNKPTKIKDLILNNSINWFSIQSFWKNFHSTILLFHQPHQWFQ